MTLHGLYCADVLQLFTHSFSKLLLDTLITTTSVHCATLHLVGQSCAASALLVDSLEKRGHGKDGQMADTARMHQGLGY